jgi:large subunit ribosomal protein L35
MPKMKTKSGAKKRFRVRGSGSIKRSTSVHSTNADSVRAMLPYA